MENMLPILVLTALATGFALEEVQRVPTGFAGSKDDSDSFAEVDKRAPPMGFHGMRGKKDEAEYQQGNEAYEKRGPTMGFHGMRGKKDEEDLSHGNDLFEKRGAGLGFHGMRGKKDQNADHDFDYVDKRAYQMGFQGVRGKKDGELSYVPGFFGGDRSVLVMDDLQENRLPEYIDTGDDTNDFSGIWQDEDDNSLMKRAQKGFFGMRGKKVASGFYGVRGKKGPSNAFFGVRGKKAPPSGFFGVRGKKVPMGFQGVRGKKDDEESLDSLLYYLSNTGGDNLEKRFPDNQNRMPSGFVNMRGRKDWDGVVGQGPVANVEAAHEPSAGGAQ